MATIKGVGFTGVSEIQLDGAVKGNRPLTQMGPQGCPVIPASSGGLGALLTHRNLLANGRSCVEAAGNVARHAPALYATAEEALDPFFAAITVPNFQDAGGSQTCGSNMGAGSTASSCSSTVCPACSR